MKPIFIVSATIALCAASALADYDVSPSLSSGQLVTNAYDDGTGSFIANVRVFPYDFDVSGPGMISYTEDPGFHPRPGSGLAGDSLYVAADSGLTYWNGSGSPAFGTVPDGETLNLAYGSQNFTVAGSTPAGSIDLDAPDSQGEFDHHLGSTLAGPGDSEPTEGIYLVALQLSSPGLTSSEPFYILYNSTDDEATIDEAAEYVRATYAPGSVLAPEPAAWALLALPLMALTRQRKA